MKNVNILGMTQEGDLLIVKLEFRYMFGFIKNVISYCRGRDGVWFNLYTKERFKDPELKSFLDREGEEFLRVVKEQRERVQRDYLRECGEG